MTDMRPADRFFDQQEEPLRGCLQFLRRHILGLNAEITERWQYGMPFYFCQGKRFCYLWVHKKLKQPYIGIVDGYLLDHPGLLQEKRARMKIFLIDPAKDIPTASLNALLRKALRLYPPAGRKRPRLG